MVCLSHDACISFGSAAMSVPSTSVSVWSMSLSRASRPSGFSSVPSSEMIAFSRSASKTVAASDSEPKAAREQPSFFWTFSNSLAC